MYSRDYLIDFIELIKEDSTSDDGIKNIFTEEYPFKLQLINVIVYILILCSGYILQKLVVYPYILKESDIQTLEKDIIPESYALIIP